MHFGTPLRARPVAVKTGTLSKSDTTIHFMRASPPPLLPIFRSATQARLLAAVYLTDRSMTIQDLSERLEAPYATVHREVGRLLQGGLLTEHRVGNARLIGPEKRSPFHRPLRELLEAAFGPVPLLQQAFEGIDGVEGVAIFGSWAHRASGLPGQSPGDIDVLVVGQPDVRDVYAACSEVGLSVGRPVNPTILSRPEWETDNPFLREVREGRLLHVIGDLGAEPGT